VTRGSAPKGAPAVAAAKQDYRQNTTGPEYPCRTADRIWIGCGAIAANSRTQRHSITRTPAWA
jgi:hypothetical protein